MAEEHGYSCGYSGDTVHLCTCAPQQIHRYLMHISGPPLDRIDIHVEAGAAELRGRAPGASTRKS